MFASKRVMSQAIVTAQRGMMIPPQTTWGIMGSAFQTCYSLITSQTARDDFMSALDNKTVNAAVIGQADIGFWRILALYNDINSPLFKKYGWDAKEFTDGAKLALESFHDVQMSVQQSLHDPVSSDSTSTSSDQKEGGSGGEKSTENADAGEMDPEGKIMMEEAAVEAGLVAALGGDSAVADLENIMHKTWAKEAEENPSSMIAALKAMVTPEFFKIIEVSSKTNHLLEKRFKYSSDSGEIKNVALLSARAVEFTAKNDDEEQTGIDYSQPMSDPSLENPPGEEKFLPIIAQIEILYDVEQIFTSTSPTSDDAGDAKDRKGKEFPEGKSVPRTSVLVGVFEGWLHGDPDGNESVRWKLAFNRPAWEFPFTQVQSF